METIWSFCLAASRQPSLPRNLWGKSVFCEIILQFFLSITEGEGCAMRPSANDIRIVGLVSRLRLPVNTFIMRQCHFYGKDEGRLILDMD